MTFSVSRDTQIPVEPGVAVWAPDGSGTVELARLAGPARGAVLAPAHLLAGFVTDPVWNLDDTDTKIRLYEICLCIGGPYDIYRYVNLGELLRLWGVLRLPRMIVETWERAFGQAGLARALARSEQMTEPGRLAG